MEEASKHGKLEMAKRPSAEMGIPSIVASDAHRLEDIGLYYVELDIDMG